MNTPHGRIKVKTWAVISLLILAMGLGCRESKPPSPQAQAFRKQVQVVLDRLAVPLAVPVVQESPKAVQKVLVSLFNLCASDCSDLVARVVVLDKDGLTISLYPPERNPEWRYGDYEVVKKAMAEKKPVQGILYRPDGTAIYVISAPIILKEEVRGVMVLVMEQEKVLKQAGLSEKEFLALSFKE